MKKTVQLGLSALLIAFVIPSGSIFAQSFEDQLQEVAPNLELAQEEAFTILDSFPPEKYYYIGVGRSPTPVLAIIENILERTKNEPNVTFVPMSNLNGYMSDMALSGLPDGEDLLLNHVMHYIPPKEILRNRKVVVIDLVAATGEGLRTGTHYIQLALNKASYPPNKAISYGFRARTHWNFDYFAPYEYFDVHKWRSYKYAPTPGDILPVYNQFRQRLKEIYNADAKYNTRICTLQLKGTL